MLSDPAIGGFQTRTLLNRPADEVNLAVEEFFADRSPDDLLLVHFSCHGVKDQDGELYFAAANTQLRWLGATAVAADFVNRRMNRSRSRRVVLLLDCCYAGAFERGMTARAGTEVGIETQFGGRGRAVITASSAMEYAFEGDELTDTSLLSPSVFTSALVEGLQTGEADRDQDGLVGLDELYDYVYDRVRTATPNQTPCKWTFGVQGDLYIARRARPVTTPAPLPPELQEAIDSPLAAVRAGVVQELARLLQSRHAGLALAARLALERLTEDDSRMVSAAATAALGAQAQPVAPPQPAPPEQAPPQPAPPEQTPPQPTSPEQTPPQPTSPEPAPSQEAPPEPAPPEPAPPRLVLSAMVVDFGRLLQQGQSPERRIRLGNAGGGILNARASTQASWLKLRQVGDELVMGVDTTAVGEYDGTVNVDSDGGPATIRVAANVDPRPTPAPQPPTAAVGQPPTAGQPTTGHVQKPPSGPPPPPEHATRRQDRSRQRGLPEPGRDPRGYYQGDKLATWRQRTGAALIDLLILVPAVILGSVGSAIEADNGNYTSSPAGLACIWIGWLALPAIWVYNSWYLQGTTGQSWGKRALHLRLVRMADKQPIGLGVALAHGLAQIVNILTVGVGYLRPLWDAQRQTLADDALGTIVISRDKTGPNVSQM